MTKIFNGTSHQISIYNELNVRPHPTKRGAYTLKGGAEPCHVIPPGDNLNAEEENGMPPNLELPFQVSGAKRFTGVDPIPEADLVVVSQKYRAGCIATGVATDKLAVIDGPVYADEQAARPCGCVRLNVG